MSLDAFRSHRLIALGPDTSAHDAARAMEDNHVGAALVIERKQLLGLVTDRDLALRVVGRGLLPSRTCISDVMSRHIATLDVEATADDAARAMCTYACRRIPLVHGEEIVGIVSLDDLVARGLIDGAREREVINAQLERGARHKPEGTVRPTLSKGPDGDASSNAARRHEARAETAYARFMHLVQRTTGIESHDAAEKALGIVASALCRRMTPEQARHFIAQLPSKLHPELERHLDGPDRRISLTTLRDELRIRLDLEDARADELLRSVCAALAESISVGELEAVRSQLPGSMKELFPMAFVFPAERQW